MTRQNFPLRPSIAKGLLAVLLCAVPGAAHAEDPPAHPSSADAGTVAPDHAEEHDFRNSLFLFLGETWERVDGTDLTEKGFTFGVEYVREISDTVSIGGILERAGGDIRGTLLLAQVYLNPVGGLYFITGPGVEFRDAYEPHQAGAEHHGELTLVRGAHDVDDVLRARDRTVFVYRVGVAYEFHSDRWVLSPTIDIDFVGRDEALVLGGLIGYEF